LREMARLQRLHMSSLIDLVVEDHRAHQRACAHLMNGVEPPAGEGGIPSPWGVGDEGMAHMLDRTPLVGAEEARRAWLSAHDPLAEAPPGNPTKPPSNGAGGAMGGAAAYGMRPHGTHAPGQGGDGDGGIDGLMSQELRPLHPRDAGYGAMAGGRHAHHPQQNGNRNLDPNAATAVTAARVSSLGGHEEGTRGPRHALPGRARRSPGAPFLPWARAFHPAHAHAPLRLSHHQQRLADLPRAADVVGGDAVATVHDRRVRADAASLDGTRRLQPLPPPLPQQSPPGYAEHYAPAHVGSSAISQADSGGGLRRPASLPALPPRAVHGAVTEGTRVPGALRGSTSLRLGSFPGLGELSRAKQRTTNAESLLHSLIVRAADATTFRAATGGGAGGLVASSSAVSAEEPSSNSGPRLLPSTAPHSSLFPSPPTATGTTSHSTSPHRSPRREATPGRRMGKHVVRSARRLRSCRRPQQVSAEGGSAAAPTARVPAVGKRLRPSMRAVRLMHEPTTAPSRWLRESIPSPPPACHAVLRRCYSPCKCAASRWSPRR